MKMRRTLAAMMSGILAMSPAGVIFADEAAQTPVTYGDMISFSLTQDGETLSADITAVYNESGDSSFSVSVTLPASMMGTEEPVVYGFDDVLRVCGEDVYLNVEEIVNIYSELTADDSMTELLSSALEYAAFEGTLSIDSADGVSAVLLDLSATAEGEDAIGVQLGIASITDGEFAEFTSPESFVSLRDVVKNVASLYYTSIASYEEPSEEISTELAD